MHGKKKKMLKSFRKKCTLHNALVALKRKETIKQQNYAFLAI
jgi:hypothetical protein